ncbi:MAG: hypothetical protein K8T25_22030 [Planctomycetia bacterium]|nr:hypothetical protein [Planctomycetia bacterium]
MNHQHTNLTGIESPRPSCRARRPHRGAITLFFVGFLLISVLVGALAVNWSYLVTVQRHMQRMGDVIALAAVHELPDQGVLRDLPTDQSTELAAARAEAERFRIANNQNASDALRTDADDLTITAGHVPDIYARLEDREFVATAPYNALRVDVRRERDGAHPLSHMINGFWHAKPVSVTATSIAAYDDQLIGFRPTSQAAAPVLPLAVSEAAWNSRTDADNNGVRELIWRLKSSNASSPVGANGALVDLGGVTVNIAKIKEQLASGVKPEHLPGGELGPLGTGPAPAHPGPLSLPATDTSPTKSDTKALADLLNQIAQSRQPCRAMPVYRTLSSGQVDVIGFVGVRVLSATDEEQSGPTEQQRLKVTLEPAFVFHGTAWTSPEAASRNPYIFKLRLLQ